MTYLSAPGLKSTNDPVYHFTKVIRSAATIFHVTEKQILSRSRRHPIIFARHAVVYVMRKKTTIGIVELGRLLNRDHSTMITSFRHAQDMIETEQYFRHRVNMILNA